MKMMSSVLPVLLCQTRPCLRITRSCDCGDRQGRAANEGRRVPQPVLARRQEDRAEDLRPGDHQQGANRPEREDDNDDAPTWQPAHRSKTDPRRHA